MPNGSVLHRVWTSHLVYRSIDTYMHIYIVYTLLHAHLTFMLLRRAIDMMCENNQDKLDFHQDGRNKQKEQNVMLLVPSAVITARS